MNKHQNLISEQEQAKLYLVHHMHHLKSFFGAKHELHHCFLYSQKDMKGEKFEIKHFLLKNGRLLHILDKKFSGTIFDHANNAFEIKTEEIGGKDYSIVG